MATARLIPSTYSFSNTQYLSVSNPNNMYANVDSTTYATFTSSRASTTSYYAYIKGFDFSSVPSDAIVSSIVIKIRGYETGLSTSTSYAPRLYNNTSTITGASAASSTFTTSASTITVPYTGDWDTLKSYGANLGIRVTIRRSNSNTQGYLYIYGAEILVTYTVPVYHTVTLSNSTSATVTVSDTNPLEGDDVVITADTLSGIIVKDNNVDITNQFVQGLTDTINQVAEGSIATSFSDSGGAFYISSSSSTTQYLEYPIGHSAESPGTATSTNTYVKGSASGNTTTGDAIYSFDFSDIPVGATIKSMSVRAYCAREESTTDSTHVCRVSVYSGSTLKGSAENVSGTSYHIHTMSSTGTWTRAELQQAKFHFTLGYYGGRIAGISWDVTYEVDSYVYTITNIVADHTIVVMAASTGPDLYVKINGTWTKIARAYRKVSGAWQQIALDQAFTQGTNYVKG